MNVITYKDVENKILTIRNMMVILDRDVAELYQVETKRVNEAVNRLIASGFYCFLACLEG